MSIYADYIRELGCREVIETHTGFVIYTIHGTECHVEDIYVSPECRQKGVASALCDKVVTAAKERGCNRLFGFVSTESLTGTLSLKSQLAYGFRLFSAINNKITLVKEI